MARLNCTDTVEKAKKYIGEGSDFEFHIPNLPDVNKCIQFIKTGDKDIQNGVLLGIQDRIAFARCLPDINQLMAYSVFRKYRIYLLKSNNQYILRFLKQ